MKPELIEGNILDQDVDVIVNAWNRNIIPWWLLLPQGVSGAIKRRGGVAPFRELARRGPLPLGGAALTGAGRLPYKGIIHVAGINMLWRASRESIMMSVCSAMSLMRQYQFQSVAFPIIGAGSGGFDSDDALQIMMSVFREMTDDARTIIVRFRKKRQNQPSEGTR